MLELRLAPLAEFTDAPFRRLCEEFGADMTYTEMVSAAALYHGSSPTLHLMERLPGERRTGCQLFGAKAVELAQAAKVATERGGFCELNLNAGCPMAKIVREGAGAELVKSPERVYELLLAMRENTDLPVTLKTRLGPHPQDTRVFELLDAAERAGAAAVMLHARYTSQLHGGAVHLEVLAEAVRRSGLPVYGNGSVTDAATLAAMADSGVRGVLIGRAALAEPAIFARLKGAAVPALSPVEWARRHLRLLLEFRQQLAERFPADHVPGPDGFASVKFHTHLFRYFRGLPGAAELRRRLNSIRTLAEIEAVLESQSAH